MPCTARRTALPACAAQELKPARIYTQELQSLSRLRQLLHLSMRGSSAMHRLPPLASCPSLESYSVDDACQASAERLGVAQTVLAARDDWLEERLAGLSAWVTTAPMVEPPAPSPTCIQMAGFALMALSFTPVPAADCEHAGWGGPKADGGGRPGSLRIQGILPRAPPRADDAGGSDGDGAGQPPAEPAPQLNDLLEAALPPGAVLQQLTLSQCDLDASALQRLPAIASLQHLQLLACSSRASGGMDAPMQALAQLAPALPQEAAAPAVRERWWRGGGLPSAALACSQPLTQALGCCLAQTTAAELVELIRAAKGTVENL